MKWSDECTTFAKMRDQVVMEQLLETLPADVRIFLQWSENLRQVKRHPSMQMATGKHEGRVLEALHMYRQEVWTGKATPRKQTFFEMW